MPDSFENQLTNLLNECSEENDSNTPDAVLAQFMKGCLDSFNQAVQQRETFHGRDARPTVQTLG